MTTRDELGRLLKKATASMKSDLKGAVATLAEAYAIAQDLGDGEDAAVIAEELSRAWARRKSPARSLYYARAATKLAPEQKSTWTTLAKSCELVATRQHVRGAATQGRARALYKAAAQSFKKAASMTRDPEDKRWLLELAGDAAKHAKV